MSDPKPNAAPDPGAGQPASGRDAAANGAAGDAKPKIHVDADWKEQARAEKERLSREIETEGPAAGTAGPGAGPGGRRTMRLPAPDFGGLVQSLAAQAALFLSDQRDPETGRSLRNLDLAKYHIDLLSVLDEKTAGNLTDEEKRTLDSLLYELRMAYVNAAS
jgi:hypothetical protein